MSGDNQEARTEVSSATQSGAPIAESAEILMRQIHPKLFLEGKLASTAFVPTEQDQGKLSLDRSSLTTASAALELYVANGRESIAVFGVAVEQFNAEDISCHSDPTCAKDGLKANLAHAYANYTKHDPKIIKKKLAQRLRDKATARGILHSA